MLHRYAGDNDVTVLLKPQSGSRRWQHVADAPASQQRQAALQEAQQQQQQQERGSPVERNYTVILGSHRNSCLKFEKDGELCCMVRGGAVVVSCLLLQTRSCRQHGYVR